jgi:hypothetical protein
VGQGVGREVRRAPTCRKPGVKCLGSISESPVRGSGPCLRATAAWLVAVENFLPGPDVEALLPFITLSRACTSLSLSVAFESGLEILLQRRWLHGLIRRRGRKAG